MATKAKAVKETSMVRLPQNLVDAALQRWDVMMAIPVLQAVGPRKSKDAAVRFLLDQALRELDRLDREAGGARADEIARTGNLFSRKTQ